MITAALVLAGILAQSPQAPDTAVYNNFVLNLAFTYPKSWTSSTKKDVTTLLIPLGAGAAKAKVEIFQAIYGAEPESWQKIQVDIDKQLNREILKQWQEEIFGVPMLFTKAHYYDHGADMQALTGLLYNRSYKKLLIRMVAPTGSYDAVEYELRNALQSLRTIDGSTPKPETPNRPVLPEETKPAVDPGIVNVTVIENKKPKGKIYKGEQVEKLMSGGKSVEFHYGKDWTLAKTATGYELKNPKFTGSVLVSVNSVLDSDAPMTALFKASGQTLDLFQNVHAREETPSRLSRAGCKVTTIWRDGTGQSGPLTTCEALGTNGDYYWLLTFQGGKIFPADKNLVNGLIQTLSIDLVQ